MEPDPTLARIREVRRRISEEFGHDPKRLIEHYIELQQRHRDRLVKPSRPQPKSESDETAEPS